MNLDGKKPLVTEDGFIAPNATVIGDVEIGNHASVWYNCVIKGDLNPVRIALYANVQDNTVIHTSDKEYTGVAKGVQVGSFSTIGMLKCLLRTQKKTYLKCNRTFVFVAFVYD